MHTDEAMKPSGSPVSGVIPESGGVDDPVASTGRRNPASVLFAKLLSVIRGDKYLVGAYPPAWHSATAVRDGDEVLCASNDAAAAAHVQSAVAPDSNPAERAEPGEPATREH
jgi:hypothetical protein